MQTEHRQKLTSYIIERIQSSGLSTIEIAQRCGFESDAPIRALLNGTIHLPIDKADRLAAALGRDPDYMIVLALKAWMEPALIARIDEALLRYPPGSS